MVWDGNKLGPTWPRGPNQSLLKTACAIPQTDGLKHKTCILNKCSQLLRKSNVEQMLSQLLLESNLSTCLTNILNYYLNQIFLHFEQMPQNYYLNRMFLHFEQLLSITTLIKRFDILIQCFQLLLKSNVSTF